MDESTEQQPRIPGVKYRRVTRYRLETTTINGIPETEEVPYQAWEPQPPRDWDGLVIRSVTAGAIGVTVVAAGSTAASIGGLLDKTIPSVFAYGAAFVFILPWLACQGVEYVLRREPKRALKARVAGWFLLLISMGAVLAFGIDKGEEVAGAAGAAVDFLSKGMWVIALSMHNVPLSRGTANWLRKRKEKLTADAVVAADTRRLDQVEAYNRAVFPNYGAAQALTTVTDRAGLEGVTTVTPGVVAPAPAAVQAAAPSVSYAEVSVPSVPPAAAPAPAQPVVQPSAAPAAPAAAPAARPADARERVLTSLGLPLDAPGGGTPVPTPAPQGHPTPAIHAVGGPYKSDTIRAALISDPTVTDAALIELVEAEHGADPANKRTVPRTRRRIEAKLKQKKAS
ncbi:hypothetical protein [Streptomyces anulatus]|uniref:hypothetical protein n=1 Tax=Streptomyces anulatus TaxID=1892 RepID=UPI0036BF8499